MEPTVRLPDSSTTRYVVYIVRYVGHDGDVYTREYCTYDKESALRVAKAYWKSGKEVAYCEETTTIRTLLTAFPDLVFEPVHVRRGERQ